MRQMALALDRLFTRIGAERDVMVVYTDLPHSDFASLFATLETSPDRYRCGGGHVFASAIGRSFYERLFSASSLILGWSSFALHWMSAMPVPLSAHIWPIFATPGEAVALAAVAASDWRRFLAHRARELVPGGQLVLIVGAVDEVGATGLGAAAGHCHDAHKPPEIAKRPLGSFMNAPLRRSSRAPTWEVDGRAISLL